MIYSAPNSNCKKKAIGQSWVGNSKFNYRISKGFFNAVNGAAG